MSWANWLMLGAVGGLRTVYRHLVEQLLDLREIFQLYLLDEKYVHLRHHVHRLQQILRVVAVLLEEGVETMVNIALEILRRTYLRQYLTGQLLMMLQNLLQTPWLEVVAGKQVQKLPERKTAKIVTLHNAVQLGILFLQTHHTRTGEHNPQTGITVVAVA